MAKSTQILVTNNGSPVGGIEVTAGEMDITKSTDGEGKIIHSLPDDFKRVITFALNGAYFSTLFVEAGGSYEIKLKTPEAV